MLKSRGSRKGILIVGDSDPANQHTISNISRVLDPIHPVYNSLIVPIKFYINNYLNSHGYKLPIEEKNNDYFYYINAVQNPKTKSNPDLTEMEIEVKRPEHKIILSMGNFSFWAVESRFDKESKIKKNLGIKNLGKIFYDRINKEKIEFPINLPILHNSANRKFEEANKFIMEDQTSYISYFHYVGVSLGRIQLKYKNIFRFELF